MNEKPSRSVPNTASASNPAAAPGLRRATRRLRHRPAAAEYVDRDLDRSVRDPTREHPVQAAERLAGLGERGLHRPRRGRGDDPALGNDRAVPVIAEIADVAAGTRGFDGGTPAEE